MQDLKLNNDKLNSKPLLARATAAFGNDLRHAQLTRRKFAEAVISGTVHEWGELPRLMQDLVPTRMLRIESWSDTLCPAECAPQVPTRPRATRIRETAPFNLIADRFGVRVRWWTETAEGRAEVLAWIPPQNADCPRLHKTDPAESIFSWRWEGLPTGMRISVPFEFGDPDPPRMEICWLKDADDATAWAALRVGACTQVATSPSSLQ